MFNSSESRRHPGRGNGTVISMTVYRNEPRIGVGAWWAILAVFGVALLVPSVIWVATPRNIEAKQVIVGDPAGSYILPLTWEDASPMACDVVAPLTGGLAAWDCYGTVVETIIMDTGDDPTVAIRRWMRAFGANDEALTADVYDDQGVLVLPLTEEMVGVSVIGAGENDGATIFTYITGPDALIVADAVVASAVGESAVAQLEVSPA